MNNGSCRNTKIVEFGAKNKLIPVISGGIGGYYLDGYAKFDLGNPPVAEFAKELRESKNKSNTAGWVVYAILNVLILLNWLVAPTGTYVAPTSRNSGTGGLSLYQKHISHYNQLSLIYYATAK